ncbi:MAG: type 1 glutamine amidotransferase [Pseudomonadota bacterium]
MQILVLQHARVEHPGVFRDFLQRDGHSWDAIELDEGEALPGLDGYDALWVMGGPMDVWQEDQHPWLKAEKAIIREAVLDQEMPFLGLCLGHQLLAEALGGKVGPSKVPEIGVMDVQVTDGGALFDGMPATIECLQWHSAEVTELPVGARVLASSPACAVQAMAWKDHAYALQFHMEIEADTAVNWAEIPEYAGALDKAMGTGAVARLAAECAARMGTFNAMAEQLYGNWVKATSRPG